MQSAFRFSVLFLWAILGTHLVAPLFGQSNADIPGTEFIANEQIRVGINARYGGSVVHISAPGGPNLVNNFDLGRQLQLALYAGPNDYSTRANNTWTGLGYNPIQAGSTFGSPSEVVKLTNQGGQLYCKTIPKQFAYPNEPGEVTMEHWVRLEGNTIRVHAKICMFRSDKAPYDARPQEWPCLYGNPSLNQFYAYKGNKPFTNDTLSYQQPPMEMQDWRSITEPWIALLNRQGTGLGLYTPNQYQFTTAFFGDDQQGDQYSSSSSYIAATPFAVIDHNGVYEFDYTIIMGNLGTIRNYVYTHEKQRSQLDFHFRNSRQGWHFFNCHDQGWPIKDELRVDITNAKRDQILSPFGVWKGADNPRLYLRAAFALNNDRFRLQWRNLTDAQLLTLEDRIWDFPIINDGQFHTYEIDLRNVPHWMRTTVAQLSLRPIETSSTSGTVRIQWLQTTPDPPVEPTTTANLLVKNYNCQTGVLELMTEPISSSSTYFIPGIQNWTSTPTMTVPEWLRNDPLIKPLRIYLQDGNRKDSTTFSIQAYCQAPISTTPTPPVTQPETPSSTLSLRTDCVTGTLTLKLNTTDARPIAYAILGVRAFSRDSVFTLPEWLVRDGRSDGFRIQARQGDQVLERNISLRSECPQLNQTYQTSPVAVTTTPTNSATATTAVPSCTAVTPLISPVAATLCLGQSITFTATSSGNSTSLWTYSGGSAQNGTKLTMTPTVSGPLTITLTQQQPNCPALSTTTSVLVSVCAPPVAKNLTILEPRMNCSTRKLTIVTQAGDGNPIRYGIDGIATDQLLNTFIIPPTWPISKELKLMATQGKFQATRSYWLPKICL